MKKTPSFAPVGLGVVAVLVGILSLATAPHTAMVSPDPIVVSSPNHFRAEYITPTLQVSAPIESDKPHTMAASNYSLQGNLKSSISLNNKGLVPLEVKPTLFNLAGERLDIPPVTVDATSVRVFDIAEWASPGGQTFQQGSLQLFYRGKDLLLGAQVRIIDSASSLIFDEQLSEPKSMISSRLEGLWWLPSHDSQVNIAISNTTDSTQIASLDVEGIAPKQQESKELILQPHQTILIDPAQDLSDKPAVLLNAGGVSIRHLGEPGALIARAMIQDASTGFSSAVQFSDPKKAKSTSLNGAGLRLGEIAGEALTPVVVARNISEKPAVLRGRIPYTRSDGRIVVMPLREVHLRPGEMKDWEIREVGGLKKGEAKSAGLEFDYNTEPGSVIVSALSVSKSSNHVFQVPMLDAAAQKSSTGVYPFYFYGSSTTFVYIKNTTTVEQKYVAHLNYEGGKYMMGVKTITPGETVTIDVLALRDNQVPDEEARTIPREITHGQIRWTIIQQEGTDLLAMIGRSEQVDEVNALSSTYACQNCCGDFPQGVFITPSQADMQVGESVTMRAFEQRVDCYGFQYFVEVIASWSSDNTSVATVSGGQVTPRGAGQATIKATWHSFNSLPTQCSPGSGFEPGPIGEPAPCCRANSLQLRATATVQVLSVQIKLGGVNITNTTRDVIVGQQISLVGEVQPGGPSISSRQWTVPGVRVANYTASTSQGQVTELTSLTTSAVDFYWVDGEDGRQVTYSVTIGSRNFTATATFNVKRPTSNVTTTTGPILVRNEESCVLRFGTPQSHGIDFVRTRQIPAGFSGITQWVQVANPDRREKRNNNTCWHLTGGGLDTSYPYETVEQTAQDSPGANLEDNSVEESVDDSFTMWLMFKPSLSGSIWVPLKKVTWGWTALARRNAPGCNWILVSSSKKPIIVTDTTEFPVWSNLVNTNIFNNVPCQ